MSRTRRVALAVVGALAKLARPLVVVVSVPLVAAGITVAAMFAIAVVSGIAAEIGGRPAETAMLHMPRIGFFVIVATSPVAVWFGWWLWRRRFWMERG
ncbi:MAG: hypothetical protein OXL38_01760 [Gammaproteobacteria bacterium]|nr:hypothetical protein [Gammaproteobacteria bacterium]